MKLRPRATWVFLTPLIFALLLPSRTLLGQTVDRRPDRASTADDAAKRLLWLKSRGLAPAPAPANTPAPAKRFAAPRIQALRPIAENPVESSEVKKSSVEKPVAAASPATPAPDVRTAKGGTSKTVSAKTAAVSEAKFKVTPAEEPLKKTAQGPTAKETGGKSSTAITTAKKETTADKTIEKRSASVKPATPGAKIASSAGTRTLKTTAASSRPATTPATRKPSSPPTQSEKALATASRLPEVAAGPALTLKTPATTVALAPSSASRIKAAESKSSETKPASVSSRYAWKTNIVTTVFWVGEAPAGNNFTPNYSSSWDMNWARSYGGFDNPDPDKRRNFLPVKFTPRQNPFYIALPYNDVTRGTTKPEARRVIPWFKDAFEREGQSVCRNRWVAVRSRSGKVAYAQWSDCGPFRTDHWQYVFGKERPKPNLNKGAGLDVSPAVRDYLGLRGTDVTDWKFVEASEVPRGPWATHGENNTAMNRGSRMAKRKGKPAARAETKLAAVR